MENASLTARHPILRHNPPVGYILLDPYGYISCRTNATTADGLTRDKKRIKVTFWAAKPPLGSYFTFCSPDLQISDFADQPRIMATEDDLVLVRFPICPRGGELNSRSNHYFVYRAGTEDTRPSLDLIPSPPLSDYVDSEVGLLPCHIRGMYFVAVLRRVVSSPGQYILHLYNSKTKEWTTKSMLLHQEGAYKNSTKAIAIGGPHGSLGWVDLCQGILICDVLLDNHELRYIPLPPTPAHQPNGGPPPLGLRDIIFFDGCIKFVKIGGYTGPGGWQADTHIWKDSIQKWEQDCEIKVTEDSALPTMKGSYLGYPSLSLHYGDVVYIMVDRQDLQDREALVIAVDLRKHIVTDAAIFRSGRPLFYSSPYLGSRISKYFSSTR